MAANRGEELLQRIRQVRGYTLPMHEVLASDDPEFLEGYEAFYAAAMRQDGPLPPKVRELILIGVTMALGSPERVTAGHIRRAMEHGASEAEVLSAIEITTLSFAARALAAGTASYQQVTATKRFQG
jgi:4-carboxymuconolactone decarboxylase